MPICCYSVFGCTSPPIIGLFVFSQQNIHPLSATVSFQLYFKIGWNTKKQKWLNCISCEEILNCQLISWKEHGFWVFFQEKCVNFGRQEICLSQNYLKYYAFLWCAIHPKWHETREEETNLEPKITDKLHNFDAYKKHVLEKSMN